MTFAYRGYYSHKNRISGKKVYSPVLQEEGAPARKARRWFLKAADAERYGVLLSLRITRLRWTSAATPASVRWIKRLFWRLRLWIRSLQRVSR